MAKAVFKVVPFFLLRSLLTSVVCVMLHNGYRRPLIMQCSHLLYSFRINCLIFSVALPIKCRRIAAPAAGSISKHSPPPPSTFSGTGVVIPYSNFSVYEQSVYEFSLVRDAQINTCFPIYEPVFACTSSFLSQTDRCSRLEVMGN
jgi:hypothetical protein